MNRKKNIKIIILALIGILFLTMSTIFIIKREKEMAKEIEEIKKDNIEYLELGSYHSIKTTNYQPKMYDITKESVITLTYYNDLIKGIAIDFEREKVLISLGGVHAYFDDYVVCDLDDELKKEIYKLMLDNDIYTIWNKSYDRKNGHGRGWELKVLFENGEAALLEGKGTIYASGQKN